MSLIISIERFFDKYPTLLYVGVFTLFGLVRLSLLPWDGIGIPDDHDEYSYLLQAETFAMGRLTNPTPDQFEHFESFHIIQEPTYASKYPPGQSIFLFLGIKLFGHPWYGVLLSCMLMTTCIVWMIRGYSSSIWALTVGIFVIITFSFWNYWSSSYWGGAVAAMGGALVMGAIPRFKSFTKHNVVLASSCFGIGLILLSLSRPLEGLMLSFIPGVYFMVSFARKLNNRRAGLALAQLGPTLLLILAGFLFHFHYNQQVTGNPLKMPYQVHSEQYGVQTPVLVMENKQNVPEYNHQIFSRFYNDWEIVQVNDILSYVKLKMKHGSKFLVFFFFWPILVFISLPFIYQEKIGVPYFTFILFCAMFLLYPWFHPHYFAPALGIFYLLLLYSIKYLLNHKWALPRILACVVLPLLLVFNITCAKFFNQQYPGYINGQQEFAHQKQRIIEELSNTAQRHLIFVKYSEDHPLHEEWVYNGPDLQSSKIIWARYISEKDNQQLEEFYGDRLTWTLQPDDENFTLKRNNH